MSKNDFVKSRIVTVENAQRKIGIWKMKGESIVFTNGCFDILHKGHVTYLAKAADLGNRLVVGLNSDASVKRQGKGDEAQGQGRRRGRGQRRRLPGQGTH